MAIIPKVGRSSWKIRLAIGLTYITLSLLGLTMVVPFMMTVSSSMSNDFDYERHWPAPRYLWSRPDRFIKGLVLYFNDVRQMWPYFNGIPEHWTRWPISGRDLETVDRVAGEYLNGFRENEAQWKLIAADYSQFMDGYLPENCICTFSGIQGAAYLEQLYSEKYSPNGVSAQDGLQLLNKNWGTSYESFFYASFGTEQQMEQNFLQTWFPDADDSKYQDFMRIKEACFGHYFTPGVKNKWLKYLRAHGINYKKANEVFPVTCAAGPGTENIRRLWREFKAAEAPATSAIPMLVRLWWYRYLESEEVQNLVGLSERNRFTVDVYNRMAGTQYRDLWKTPCPVPADFGKDIQKLWRRFVETRYPARWTSIRVTPALEEKYRNFLKEHYKNIEYFNQLVEMDYKTWDEVPLYSEAPRGQKQNGLKQVWANFVVALPFEERILHSSEISYQKYLLEKYHDLAAINRTCGWNLGRIEEAYPRLDIAYTVTFVENEWALTRAPMLFNYTIIWNYLLKNSRAIPVTLLLVGMSILCTLTINPVAAYALSRFNMKGQDKVIVYMLATIAFPAMVSAIPAYLLMRDFHLLNTFFALILPGAANGMAIFILKGFFDSLPPELYEAATIDGAREWQIFLMVTMPMVKPILAINALGAFVAAYNGWEWAIIICQNKQMWTIAVWMYQASQWFGGSPWIVTAGFVVTSIPTLLVFLFCQKIILRGIVIPSMK